MERPYRADKKTSFLARPAIVFFLFLLSVLAIYSVVGMYGKYRKAASAREISENERADLEEKHLALAESTERLGTERGQEEELRSRYRAVRPGEELIVIVDDGNTLSENEKKVSWFQLLFSSISGLFLEEK
ncbi:MAG: hypothetical protein KBC98_01975 [Candidatus Pacebacteria bacterium]|jgi:hypothetical protein|nr:hypothetical protein [Candidatus Paceibacterota bacterium]